MWGGEGWREQLEGGGGEEEEEEEEEEQQPADLDDEPQLKVIKL